jgi:putative peptidoglycan lipid II flippase
MEVLTRAFYAQQDTKTPVIIGVIAMGLNVVFSITFSKLFASIGWLPLGGLAFANSLATALEATALFIVMRKRLNGIEGNHILRGAIPAFIAVSGMAFALFALLAYGKNFSMWILVPAGVLIGGIVYFAILFILKVPELSYMVNGVMRRLKR